MKNKAVDAPIKSEKIVMVMIKSVITLIQVAFVEVTHFDIIMHGACVITIIIEENDNRKQ